MTDTDWSFSLRSATGFCDAPDSDDDDGGTLGDAGTPSHFSSSNSLLQQIDLALREDSAQYKPNPWSIARVNAATRSQQPNATVNSVLKKPAARKPPQGAIVDAFRIQAQKPTKSSAQANLPQTSSKKPTFACVNGALDNLVAVPARSLVPIAHISASDDNLVPIPSQPPTMVQRQSPPLPSFLPRKASPTFHPSKSTPRPPNLHFTPNLKRALSFSSPGPPPLHHQRSNLSTSRPLAAPAHSSPRLLPHILEPQTTTTSSLHLVADHLAPVASASKNLAHSSQSYRHPTPMKLEGKTMPPFPGLNTRLPPRPWPNQPITKASPKSENIPSSPSFAQARRFFEHGPPLLATIKQPCPGSPPPEEESHPAPPRTISPPRKRINAYDQLPPSPDSKWSTLKPPIRKVNNKTKPKAPDVKSGKFRLPLSLGTITPKELLPRNKGRVITYLPPPPPKKQKIAAEPYLRTRTSLLPSPPPSDETAPPSSPTPSVLFDSNGVSTRYKIVRAKIRQRKALDVQLWDILGLDSWGVVYRDPEYTDGVSTWNGEITFVTWYPRGD